MNWKLFEQLAVIKFLIQEQVPFDEIAIRLKKVFGEDALNSTQILGCVTILENQNMSLSDVMLDIS